ncbi:MAG: TerC/Alx family metal homeostasis membrane protein [Bacteroidales bacterium]|nr:TerC/Alx family metal homeostasis membrane protein [Bacteroidales bacterium]
MNEILFLGAILFVVISVICIDLLVIGKESHKPSFRESLMWTIVWISLAIFFFIFLKFYGYKLHDINSLDKLKKIIDYHDHPIKIDNLTYSDALKKYNNNLALEFITGYFIEYTLSLDNIFVILLIFLTFNINEKYYKKVLFWGILGAIVFRFLFIFFLSALVHKFEFIFYIFGAILFYSGIKIIFKKDKKENIKNHIVIKVLSKFIKIKDSYSGPKFIIKENGSKYITPLFVSLLIVEFSDIIFAIDSVPAIFSVTKDPYLVYFSNIFAILGLRTLFFLVVNMINYFKYLKHGVSVLLMYIGIKLIFHSYLKQIGFSPAISLVIVLSVLLLSILASIISELKAKK